MSFRTFCLRVGVTHILVLIYWAGRVVVVTRLGLGIRNLG